MTKSMVDYPPGKVLRFGLRLPFWLYRLRLGWLLGNRFLMLTHKGRKGGFLHETVIEVARYDKETDTYYVVSGRGMKSDSYQNVQFFPAVTVDVGRRRFQAPVELILLAESIEIIEGYAHEHPLAFSELNLLFLGEHMQPGKDAARRLAEKMPIVSMHPFNLLKVSMVC